jgi:DNA polymerase-3 subunit gamma/tau
VAQLSIKYRPGKIEDVAGNSSVKKQLKALMKRDRKDIPKVFGFFGLSGGGKTTLARIVARELDCPASEFYELNAASMRGIDTIRDIEKQIRYSAMSGSCRIWLLDEVHQYPAASQEALLKMFEECPSHVYFMICTTNPEKLKPALKNRCVSFEVAPLTDEEMYNLLVMVVEAEESDVPDSILDKIVANASGSSRNALQLLEKVIDLDSKEMSSVALKMSDEETTSKELFDALIAKKDWKVVAKIIKSITAESETIRYSMMGLANAMLLGGYGNPKQAALVLECFGEDTYTLGKNGITLFAYRVICQ